jgi:hypothetical protein
VTSLSYAQKKNLLAARRRPLAEKICNLPEGLVKRLLSFWEARKQHDILQDSIECRIDRDIPTRDIEKFDRHYSQISLQYKKHGGDTSSASDYVIPVSEGLVGELQSLTGTACHMRISALKAGGALPTHIDDPEQTRALALLRGSQEFSVEDESGRHLIEMSKGELWFINTAWPHRVRNPDSSERVALLLNLTAMKFA